MLFRSIPRRWDTKPESCIAGNSILESNGAGYNTGALSPGEFLKWHDQKPVSLDASSRKKFMDACDSIYSIFQRNKLEDWLEVDAAYKKLTTTDQKQVSEIVRSSGDSYQIIGESVVGPVSYVDTSPNNLTSYGNSEEAGRLTLAKVLRISAQMVGGSVDIPNLIVELSTDDRVQKLLYALNAHRGYISGLSRNEAAVITVISPSQTREFKFYPDGTITKVS